MKNNIGSASTLLRNPQTVQIKHYHKSQNKKHKQTRLFLYSNMNVQSQDILTPKNIQMINTCIAITILKFEQCGFIIARVMCPKDADGMVNSVDPDQTA